MTRVLIVDDDPLLRLALAQGLRRADLDVSVAETVDEAIQALGREVFDVMVTDLRLSEGDAGGIEVLTEVRRISPKTRTILMSGYATARDYETAMQLGAVSVLCKPIPIPDLLAAVRRAAESAGGFHGSFHGMSLIDLLQMLHLARRDITVYVDAGSVARIDLVRGDIVHAECGLQIGEDAFRMVMGAPAGSFRTSALVPGGPITISRSFDGLLLDTIRSIDETDRDARKQRRSELSLSQFPDDFFGPATVEVPIPRPSAVPADASITPATSASLEHARDAWVAARSVLGSAAADVVAIAFDPEGGRYVELVLDHDPVELAKHLVEINRSLCRMAGREEIVACCLGDGFGVGVVCAPSVGYAIGMTEALSSSSSAMLFRSLVATTARCVLERRGG